MKIFICGLPKSGRTTVAKSLSIAHSYQYIDAMSWVRSGFREPKPNEHPHQYEDEYQKYLSKRMQVNPCFISDHVNEMIKVAEGNNTFVIDGVASPRELATLFDYKSDIIIFLNRIDNDIDGVKDHESIGISVMRDYCFWMSSINLLSKHRWLEYNFRIPGEKIDSIRSMGAQNTVFIIKSFEKVLSHVQERIKELSYEISR